MRKFIALVPFFCFAACSAIRIDYTKQVSAGETGGAGGASIGSGMGGLAGNAAFCTCESEVEKDGERLRRQYMIGADGSKMATQNWTDTEIGETCSFQKLPNGDTRCVPEHVPTNVFLDSACTKPVYIKKRCNSDSPLCTVEYPSLGCAPTDRYVRVDGLIPDMSCVGKCDGFTIYGIDIGNQLQGVGNMYAHKPDGTCAYESKPSTSYFDYAIYGVYKIGDESKFVSAK